MTKTKLNTLLATTAVLALAACGGSSTGSSVASYTALKVFSDGAGVGRGVDADGNQLLFISPDINQVVAEANRVTENDLANVQLSDFPVVEQLSTNANRRDGTFTFNGVTANVIAIEDLGGEAGIIYFEIPNTANLAMATGTKLGSLPSGNFLYAGTLVTGLRDIDPILENGSFQMTTNFDTGTFTFSGSTLSDTVNGSGFINTSSGQLSSNQITMNTSGENRSATMYGQFHGSSAQSVSGVFHSNESNPAYAGAFVGSR